MKKDKQVRKLINYLIEINDWVSAFELAEYLEVTTRTIRNYIREINTQKLVIESSVEGYKIGHDINELRHKEDTYYVSPKDRRKKMLNILLIDRELNYLDFADEYNISYSTIEKDLVYVRKSIADYHIAIIKKGEMLLIEAKELALRKLIYDTIIEESKEQIISNGDIYSIVDFGIITAKQEDIAVVETILNEMLVKNNLVMNDYAKYNILLHLMIAIERISTDYTITTFERLGSEILHHPVRNLALDICNEIGNHFSLTFNEQEIIYLSLLLLPKVTQVFTENNTSNLAYRYIDKEIARVVERVLEKVEEKFLVAYNNPNFILNFTMHIQNMILRDHNNKSLINKNPFTEQMKLQSPLIYEIAVFVSNELQQAENIVINENEITFLALHLGMLIQYEKNELLSTLLIFPEFHDLHLQFIWKIEANFATELKIDYTTKTMLKEEYKEYDLIISAATLLVDSPNIVKVSPFLDEKGIHIIKEKIIEVKKKKKQRQLALRFDEIIVEPYFKTNVYLSDEIEYINFMCDDLYQDNMINDDFKDSVIEREKLSSTVFCENVAMPHALLANANKTCLYIILNNKKVTWGNSKVRIIILIALSNKSSEHFSEFFDVLVELLSDKNKTDILLKSKNYHEFIRALVEIV